MEFHENLMGFHGNFQWDLGMGPMGNQWDLTNDGKSRAVNEGRPVGGNIMENYGSFKPRLMTRLYFRT
jgi:hypothetical protein